MLLVKDFEDYEILGMSNGEKLERWKDYYLLRPDPEIIWKDKIDKNIAHAHYHRSNKGGGYWEKKKPLPDRWTVNYKNLTFNVKLMGFKHTGIFPEQSINWDFMMNKIEEEKKKTNKPVKVLNLFAYTGCATMMASASGATETVHVDASKSINEWAKENMHLCGLDNANIRFIVDDCLKFVLREARRGNKYDVIIMDPPSYGRGPNGEMWKFEKNLDVLINACMDILSDKPLFFLINAYTTGISNIVLYNILKTTLEPKFGGKVESGEIGLPVTDNSLVLPCGIYGRWSND